LSPKTPSRLLSYTQPVPVDSGSPQEASMVHDSEDILDAFAIIVWLVVLCCFSWQWRSRAHSLDVLYSNEQSDVINVLPAS
jgi:hypothetical protein